MIPDSTYKPPEEFCPLRDPEPHTGNKVKRPINSFMMWSQTEMSEIVADMNQNPAEGSKQLGTKLLVLTVEQERSYKSIYKLLKEARK